MRRRLFLWKALLSIIALMLTKFIPIFRGRAVFAAAGEGKPDRAPSMRRTPKVVSVHSDRATSWDFSSYPYVDFSDYETVREMVSTGIQSLTGETTVSRAWRSLFHSYRKGELIAIKPNFNDLYMGFGGLITSPAAINAVLDGLVNVLGIHPENIVIYDCTRVVPDEFRRRILFPVGYVEPFGSSFMRRLKYHVIGNPLIDADLGCEIEMESDVRDKSGNRIKCYLPRVLTMSRHLINMPVLKSHQFVSHSGAMKNHYGTVIFSDGHTSPEYLHPPIIHQSIADINCNEQILGKTRLVVMDALFARGRKKGGPPDRWKMFDNGCPNRLLISLDPVALDSVSLSMVEEELRSRGEALHPHDYLHIADDKGIGLHGHPDEQGKFGRIGYLEVSV
jgi:uncharacterized protein (DUF362 family)